ncbi:hypothetical protein E4T39_03347 [Aureobasidium subglaciale]|nr:hypothetical protein E4T39_03347 [Aureobasidium subglaciale]
MATINPEHVRLALSLPPRLLNFFKRYPPPALSQSTTGTTTIAANTSSADANANTPTAIAENAVSGSTLEPANPFMPFKNPVTQRWQPASFSLRKQSEIIKLAIKHDVVSLLPYTHKLPEEVARRRAEHGLRVKGTGVGQKVKGKMWERTLKGRLDQREKAMVAMPEMIRHWKERGHGRGWKKWPKS